MLAASLAAIALHGHHHLAYAKHDDSASDDDDNEDSNDSGDKADKNDDDDDTTEEDERDDKDQPPVTAGGLFTKDTYPLRETERPLTMTEGILQLTARVGTDISAKGAFDSAGLSLEAIYGLHDNFSLIGGFDNAYNMNQFSVYGGFEAALAYDLLDIRVAANLHRSAIAHYANFCDPPATPGEIAQGDPNLGMQTCQNAGAEIDNLPSGSYFSGGTQFSIDVGFPFRYAFTPAIALVALQTLVSIDFNGVAEDHVIVLPNPALDTTDIARRGVSRLRAPDGTVAMTQASTITELVGNSAKPDLNPSIGFLTNPIPQLSIVVQAQLRIPDFDTAAGSFVIPLTASVEFAPNHRFDIGLSFTLLNVIPPDPQSPIDNRFLSAYVNARL